MSWDIAFWKPADPVPEDPNTVYDTLIEEGEPVGLAWLPVSEVKSCFRATFADIDDNGTELNWEGAGSYFQVTWPVGSKPQHTLGVLVFCGWNLLKQSAVIERIRAVGFGLGCGVFDPQTNQWSDPAGNE